MTRWQMITGAIKASWQTWRNKRREERWLNKMSNDVQVWDASKTASKAKAAAVPVGVAAAIVAMLRALLGEKLPWGPENDAWAAGILMTALSGLFAYVRDKRKHNGGAVFHTLTPEELYAQSAGLAKMHDLAEAKRAAKEKNAP